MSSWGVALSVHVVVANHIHLAHVVVCSLETLGCTLCGQAWLIPSHESVTSSILGVSLKLRARAPRFQLAVSNSGSFSRVSSQ